MEVKCSKCGENKCSTEYYQDKRSNKDVVRQPCKECTKLKEKIKRDEYTLQEKCIPERKVCSCCKEDKDSSEFHKRKDTPTGLRDKCKVCYNKSARKYKEKVKI